jgi:hypothetical protein
MSLAGTANEAALFLTPVEDSIKDQPQRGCMRTRLWTLRNNSYFLLCPTLFLC